MKNSKIIIIILCLFFTDFLASQNLRQKEVTVIEGFNPKVPDVVKIKEIAVVYDTVSDNKSQTYNFIKKSFSVNYDLKPIKFAKVKRSSIDSKYNFKEIHAGIGSHNSVLMAIHYNVANQTNHLNFSIDHYGNDYKIDQKLAGYSFSLFNSIYSSKLNKHLITASLFHERQSHYSYGHIYPLSSNYGLVFEDDVSLNKYIYSKFHVNVMKADFSKKSLNYNLNFFVSDLNNFAENRLHLDIKLDKPVNNVPFSLDFAFDNYSFYNNISLECDNCFQDKVDINLLPKINFNSFELGLLFDYIHEKNKNVLNVFPEISYEKELVVDISSINLGVSKDKYVNTYKRLSQLNPYIHSEYIQFPDNIGIQPFFQDLRFTQSKDFFFNVSNVVGDNEILTGNFIYGFIENMPYFVKNHKLINTTDPLVNRFLVDYDDVWRMGAHLKYENNLLEFIELKFVVDYNYYSTNFFQFVEMEDSFYLDHIPRIKSSLELTSNLRNKIKMGVVLNYIGKRKAKDYASTACEGNGLEYYETVNLPHKFLLDIYLEYNYNKSIGTFFNFKNITNSRSESWIYYKNIGFNALFGLSYSF